MDANVLVIGGGPAGSTAAALLATAGKKVLLIEKGQFPRFHIGESLLPANLAVFERLGIDLADGGFVRKSGARFTDLENQQMVSFQFSDALPGTADHAFQVERSRLDHLLLQNARKSGVDVHEGEAVRGVEKATDSMSVTTDAGTYRVRYLIDASGQDAFTARRERSVIPLPGFGVAAVFRHFVGLPPSLLDQLVPDGSIHIALDGRGWVWMIPLGGNRLSVGFVTPHQGVRADMLDEVLSSVEMLRPLLEHDQGSRGAEIIRNFAYLNSRRYDRRYGAIGDAAAFLDPVFSSGVCLAMIGAERVADRVAAALSAGEEDRPDLLAESAAQMAHAYEAIGSLIRAFYQTNLFRNLFFAKDPDPRMRSGLISMLACDLWREDNPFQTALLGGRRRWNLPALPEGITTR